MDSIAYVKEPHRVGRRREFLRRRSLDQQDNEHSRGSRPGGADGSAHTSGAAVVSTAAKIGCTAQTLHEWVNEAEVDGVHAAALERFRE